MADDYKRTLREIKRAGWTVSRRNDNHLVITGPDQQRIVTGSTPSDSRSHANFLAALKRAGLDLRRQRRRRSKSRSQEQT